MLSADLFELAGNHFLITADRYSGFPWVDKLTTLNTKAVITKMEARFLDMGFLPQSIRADNGPQFREEFKEFCKSLTIEHVPSAPHNSQSNGHAEAAVKNVKSLLAKCEGKFTTDFRQRLQEWRNAPRADGYSPAELLYGRRQRGALPALPAAYEPIDVRDAELKRRQKQDDNKAYSDKRSRPIKDMAVGSPVVIQDVKSHRWDIYGVILASHQSGRCLRIQLDNGKVYYRNRRHVRPMPVEGRDCKAKS